MRLINPFSRQNLAAFRRKIILKYNKSSEITKDFLSLIRNILEYGILLNIMLFGIDSMFTLNLITISVQSVLGLGIFWFFMKYEIRKLYEVWRGR